MDKEGHLDRKGNRRDLADDSCPTESLLFKYEWRIYSLFRKTDYRLPLPVGGLKLVIEQSADAQ